MQNANKAVVAAFIGAAHHLLNRTVRPMIVSAAPTAKGPGRPLVRR
jgi:hypothetical protein